MRREIWVVLGLVGLAPVGALAQQQQQQSSGQAQAPQEVSNEALQQQITELWQGFRYLQGEVAQLREQLGVPVQAPAVGGSGQAGMGLGTGDSRQGGEDPARAGTPEATDDTPLIIVELPPPGEQGAGGTGAGQTGAGQTGVGVEVYRPNTGPGTGGSGMDPSAAPQVLAPNREVFQGTLRAVTADNLRMLDGTGRVYEFEMGEQARVLGPDGSALSWQALREGMVVRTVTEPGEFANEVLSVQVFGRVPVPSR